MSYETTAEPGDRQVNPEGLALIARNIEAASAELAADNARAAQLQINRDADALKLMIGRHGLTNTISILADVVDDMAGAAFDQEQAGAMDWTQAHAFLVDCADACDLAYSDEGWNTDMFVPCMGCRRGDVRCTC